MEVRIEWEKGRQQAFCPPTKSRLVAPAYTNKVQVYTQDLVDLATCSKISKRTRAPTTQPAT